MLRARWLAWIPLVIVAVWGAGWIAIQEYRLSLIGRSLRREWVVCGPESIAYRFAALEPLRAVPRTGLLNEPEFKLTCSRDPIRTGETELWTFEYETASTASSIIDEHARFAASRGYRETDRRTDRGFWIDEDANGHRILGIELVPSGAHRAVRVYVNEHRFRPSRYERLRSRFFACLP